MTLRECVEQEFNFNSKKEKVKGNYMRNYLIGCIGSDEDLVELEYHKNERFINDVVEEYEGNLKYIEEGYSEIDAKDDAIRTVANRWLIASEA